jgi:hypothetical protein
MESLYGWLERIESSLKAAGGVILAKVWNGREIVTVDQLGAEFLAAVKTGYSVSVEPDGTVTIETA